MKKYYFVICILFCISLTTGFTVISRANSSQITVNQVTCGVIIDGERVILDTPLFNFDDSTYISIRELSELLGYAVLWNGESGEISLESDEYKSKINAASFNGFLENGIGYSFIADEFDFVKFCERNKFSLLREIDNSVLAQNPTEAAAMGQYHLHPPLKNMESNLGEQLAINVRYCSVTDNWVLELVILDAEPYSILGVPMVLTINRSDGSMALYRSDTSLWLHEIEW